MNKGELIKRVSESVGESQANTERIVDAVFNTITNALKDGEDVRIHNFGVWDVRVKAAAERYSPITDSKVIVPEHKTAHFKVAKALKAAVN